MQHKNVVEECLLENTDDYKLFEKYSWVAKYHNFFCKKFITQYQPSIDVKKLIIEKGKFSKSINQII